MPSIAFHDVHKRYGPVTALDGFTGAVEPGRITAFLGANGSGKTTSMRVLLGLSAPTAGTATLNGRPYSQLEHPLRTVGAVIDQGLHPTRPARSALRVVALQAGVPASRVDDVLAAVELTDVAGRRVGGFSLGMRQRLALAAALIGQPEILVLDEPFNGLDPQGIAAMRTFLRQFADAGGTVFLSSHLLAEVAHSADDALIIDRGRLVTAGPVAGLLGGSRHISVTSPDAGLLGAALARRGAGVTRRGDDQLVVSGTTREAVARTALELEAVVLDLHAADDDLEAVFATLVPTTRSA
jgi:ABC-2 type transport system ATP-binding protein